MTIIDREEAQFYGMWETAELLTPILAVCPSNQPFSQERVAAIFSGLTKQLLYHPIMHGITGFTVWRRKGGELRPVTFTNTEISETEQKNLQHKAEQKARQPGPGSFVGVFSWTLEERARVERPVDAEDLLPIGLGDDTEQGMLAEEWYVPDIRSYAEWLPAFALATKQVEAEQNEASDSGSVKYTSMYLMGTINRSGQLPVDRLILQFMNTRLFTTRQRLLLRSFGLIAVNLLHHFLLLADAHAKQGKTFSEKDRLCEVIEDTAKKLRGL